MKLAKPPFAVLRLELVPLEPTHLSHLACQSVQNFLSVVALNFPGGRYAHAACAGIYGKPVKSRLAKSRDTVTTRLTLAQTGT